MDNIVFRRCHGEKKDSDSQSGEDWIRDALPILLLLVPIRAILGRHGEYRPLELDNRQGVLNPVLCGLGVCVLLLAMASPEDDVIPMLPLSQPSIGGFEVVIAKARRQLLGFLQQDGDREWEVL